MDHLILGRDIFGRNATFRQTQIDETYPPYLLEHLEDYRHLILPPVTSAQRLAARLDLSVGRFARKAVRKVKRLKRRSIREGEI